LSLDLEAIQKLSDGMEREAKALKNQIYQLMWFMRGSITISEAFELESEDLEIIGKIIKDNLEITKKTKLPFF
jgi:hypothetical protein